MTRRDRWVQKQKMKIQMKAYVDDYNFGYVTSGKIIPIDEPEPESNKVEK